MMKKILVLLMVAMMTISMAACGSNESSDSKEESATEAEPEVVEEEVKTPERDLSEDDYEEIGNGTFNITGPAGSSEDGTEMVFYPDMDSYPYADVGYELWDTDGSVLTYIYVDGIEQDKQQAGAGYQSSIMLTEEWQVTEGAHTVEAVQYKDNDTSGDMQFYRKQEYIIKIE